MARKNDENEVREDVAEQGSRRRTSKLPDGQEIARRFELLLKKFPRGDGEPWRAVEIEEATGGEVTSAYLSALRKGKFKRPGLTQLSNIADIMGFPFELWRIEPEFWDEEINKRRVRGSLRDRMEVPEGTPELLRQVPTGAALAELVGDLFLNKQNPSTGEPYTEEEVAARSRKRLRADEIRTMRQGNQEEPPSELKLLALCDVFDVPPAYWYSGGEESTEVIDLHGLRERYEQGRVSIRHRQEDLTPAERNMLEILFAALDSSHPAGPDRGDPEEGRRKDG